MVWKLSYILGEKDTVDRPAIGRSATTVTTVTEDKADAVIQDDGRNTSELWVATGIGIWRLWSSSRTGLQKTLRNVGAELVTV